MTSVFDVIEHEDRNDQSKVRQAMGLAHQRVEDRFGSFVRQGSVDDQAARWDLVHEDLVQTVASACAQVGYGTPEQIEGVLASIKRNFVTADAAPQLRTAGVRHEARKPKMCPYHSEVTDISLAAGDPSAGFNAMAQHAWGKNHCQGGEYEGDKCKFKPAMTTQTYWDEKAEKAQERREQREQEALQAEQEQALDTTVLEEVPAEPVGELEGGDVAVPENTDVPETTEQGDPVEQVPMAMAASTKTADGGPVPVMDKSKWTPKTVPDIDADEDDGRWPTRTKDIADPITNDQGTRFNPSELKEIGEKTTERQDVAKDTSPSTSGQGGTFGGGDRSAVSSLLSPEEVRQALAKTKRD